ncbi:MAG: large-conductance mechanosensitive channel protein MscL [Clostridia bacterium]|jgi:large conductance mechanosensitive channel
MLKEFKEFVFKGNVVDLAVGVIIGAAFGKIITSLVNDVIMPFLGAITGNINLTAMKWTVKSAQGATPELSVNYGIFLQTTLDFLLVALTIFLIIKGINKFRKKKEEEAKPSNEEILLTEIRDVLKQKNK